MVDGFGNHSFLHLNILLKEKKRVPEKKWAEFNQSTCTFNRTTVVVHVVVHVVVYSPAMSWHWPQEWRRRFSNHHCFAHCCAFWWCATCSWREKEQRTKRRIKLSKNNHGQERIIFKKESWSRIMVKNHGQESWSRIMAKNHGQELFSRKESWPKTITAKCPFLTASGAASIHSTPRCHLKICLKT